MCTICWEPDVMTRDHFGQCVCVEHSRYTTRDIHLLHFLVQHSSVEKNTLWPVYKYHILLFRWRKYLPCWPVENKFLLTGNLLNSPSKVKWFAHKPQLYSNFWSLPTISECTPTGKPFLVGRLDKNGQDKRDAYSSGISLWLGTSERERAKESPRTKTQCAGEREKVVARKTGVCFWAGVFHPLINRVRV